MKFRWQICLRYTYSAGFTWAYLIITLDILGVYWFFTEFHDHVIFRKNNKYGLWEWSEGAVACLFDWWMMKIKWIWWRTNDESIGSINLKSETFIILSIIWCLNFFFKIFEDWNGFIWNSFIKVFRNILNIACADFSPSHFYAILGRESIIILN